MAPHLGPTLEAPELQAVLGKYCLVHLPTITMMRLRGSTRAMCELVDGPSHAAWALPGRKLLPDGVQPSAEANGAEWQDNIRQEWQYQQPIRSGLLSHVTILNTRPHYPHPGWVRSAAAPSSTHSYFFYQPPEGKGTMLFDASKPESQPVELADAADFSSLRPSDCFIGTDGNMYVEERKSGEVQWRVHSPITGQRLSSPHETSAFPWPFMLGEAHTTPNRLLGMIGGLDFALMHVGTLEEVAQFGPCRGTFSRRARAARAEWSSDGALLAILYQGDIGQQPSREWQTLHRYLYEVDIFDGATGRRQQSLRFECQHAEMAWSQSQRILLVRSADEEPGRYERIFMVRVLHPMQQRVVAKETRELQAALPTRSLVYCTWQANGTLLALFNKARASFAAAPIRRHIEAHKPGASFIDPYTLQGIYWAPDQPVHQIVYASVPARFNQRHALLAFLPFHRVLVSFSCSADGEWLVQELSLAEDLRQLKHCPLISPCGSRLIGLDQATAGSFQVHHHLPKSQRQLRGTKVPHSINCGYELSWVPFPAAWQSVYVCNSSHASTVDQPDQGHIAGPCVQFVDVKTSKTLCSWTLADLVQQAGRRTAAVGNPVDMLNHCGCIGWSQDRRHLAVHLHQAQIAILTFGDA